MKAFQNNSIFVECLFIFQSRNASLRNVPSKSEEKTVKIIHICVFHSVWTWHMSENCNKLQKNLSFFLLLLLLFVAFGAQHTAAHRYHYSFLFFIREIYFLLWRVHASIVILFKCNWIGCLSAYLNQLKTALRVNCVCSLHFFLFTFVIPSTAVAQSAKKSNNYFIYI